MHTELEQGERVGRLLRALPGEALRPYDWSEFQRRAHERTELAARIVDGRRVAAALVIAVAVCAAAIRWVESGPRPAAPRAAAAPSAPATPRPDEAYAERWLASLPHEPAVVRVGTRAAVATLEDRIALVDDLLSAERAESAPPARLLTLQHERTELISSLAQVRYAETLADESRR
jgi:hypothetical protein